MLKSINMKYTLYSKDSITVSSIFLTPLVGAILISSNLREVGKGKYSMIVIIGSILWTALVRALLLPVVNNDLIALFASNALGATLFNLLLWDYFFAEFKEYEKRSPFKVVIIATSIFTALILLQILLVQIR